MSECITTQTLEADITLNYQRLMAEPQARTEHGKLVSPLAQLFEGRMNRALEEWQELTRFTGEAALIGNQANWLEQAVPDADYGA